MLSEKHDNPHKGGTEAYIATEHYNEGWNDAVAALRAQAGAQPVLWWNGLRKVDESDGTAPSFRPIEDTLHDIPLYSGVNPCNIHPAPEAAQALSDAEIRKLAVNYCLFESEGRHYNILRYEIEEDFFNFCRALLTRASAATVTEPSEQRLYTLDQMREYVEACYQARTRLMRTDPTNSMLANLVNAVRWWGAQEDGIPAEVAPAFNAAHLALGWSLSHPMDFDAANKQADQQQANPDTHRHEWNAEGERCLKCGEKDWFASSTCSGKAAQQQAEPRGDEVACSSCGLTMEDSKALAAMRQAESPSILPPGFKDTTPYTPGWTDKKQAEPSECGAVECVSGSECDQIGCRKQRSKQSELREAFMNGLAWMLGNRDSEISEWNEAADFYTAKQANVENDHD